MGQRQILNRYRSDVHLCNNIISLANEKTHRGRYVLDLRVRSFLIQSAFLKIFISWETFLEQSFLNYLTGKSSILSRKPTRFAKPIDLKHAISFTIGVNSYFDWSRPDSVIKLSKLFFDNGDPFNTTIGAITSDIFDMKTIRNAAAHLSSSTSTNLDALASRLLGAPTTNIGVYDLLQHNLPGVLPIITILENYLQLLDASVQSISEA